MKITDIYESFDSSYDIKWEYRDSEYWRGTFMVDEEEYSVTMEIESGSIHPDDDSITDVWYDLSFGITRDGFAGTKVLGTSGREMRIFGTVISAFKEFIDAVKPEFIKISASKENPNRYRVYRALVKKFSKEIASRGYREVTPPENTFLQGLNIPDEFDTIAWRKTK